MPFDLRTAHWLPWVRRSGEIFWGSPVDIVSSIEDDPVIRLGAPRPDFTGAVTEFLIGLVNVALLPADFAEWESRWHEPPATDELKEALAALPEAFSLDGDGPRFFQDLSPDVFQTSDAWSIESLLIGSPGSKPREAAKRTHITDLFVKEGTVLQVSRSTAAMALITMQTYAPQGGSGHLTSLRGGGPLTTIVDPGRMRRKDGGTLWSRIWANVATMEDLRETWDGSNTGEPSAIFPWLAPTRSSERPRRLETFPADAHPLQSFFAMPRRIRLDFDGPGNCDLTGIHDSTTVSSFRMRPSGVRYSTWMHPLSPYYRDKTEYRAVHGQPAGLPWRDWLSVAATADADSGRRPADAVARFSRRLEQMDSRPQRFDIHAFGFDMEKMKARRWIESVLPAVILVNDESRRLLYMTAEAFTSATSNAASALSIAIKSGLFTRTDDQKKVDTSLAREELWARTENEFYSIVDLFSAPSRDIAALNEAVVARKKAFHKMLSRETFRIFDTNCPAALLDVSELKRRVEARQSLSKTFAGRTKLGSEIFTALEMPLPESVGPSRKPGRRTREKRS